MRKHTDGGTAVESVLWYGLLYHVDQLTFGLTEMWFGYPLITDGSEWEKGECICPWCNSPAERQIIDKRLIT